MCCNNSRQQGYRSLFSSCEHPLHEPVILAAIYPIPAPSLILDAEVIPRDDIHAAGHPLAVDALRAVDQGNPSPDTPLGEGLAGTVHFDGFRLVHQALWPRLQDPNSDRIGRVSGSTSRKIMPPPSLLAGRSDEHTSELQ